MIKRLWFLIPIALVLPILGLSLIWWNADQESYEGTEWEVPIAGYDPRDLLRGHYVQFRYDWPLVDEVEIPDWRNDYASICITGREGKITSARYLDYAVSQSQSELESCDTVIRSNPWSEEGRSGMVRDRLYVPQAAAKEYEKQLMDVKLQGFVRIRVNNSGYITPLKLYFRKRSSETVNQTSNLATTITVE